MGDRSEGCGFDLSGEIESADDPPFISSVSGLPSFLDRTEHLNENRLCYQHFSEPFDQGL